MTATNLPAIEHKAQRAIRTMVQAAVAFCSFAALVPALTAAIGAPHGSNAAIYIGAAGVWITSVSGVLAHIMADPAVNAWLSVNGLGTVPRSSLQLVHLPTAAAALAAPAPVVEGAGAGQVLAGQ